MEAKREALKSLSAAARKAMLGSKYKGDDKPMITLQISVGRAEDEEDATNGDSTESS